MEKRELNFKIFTVMCITAVAVTVCAWTISEKFIPNPRIALVINIPLGIIIAFILTKFLDLRFNNSVDYLMRKIQRIREGDLTQRFQEDPDDILPYGLSRELGCMMDFFRTNIGNVWKATVNLNRSLDQFIKTTESAIHLIKQNSTFTATFGTALEQVKESSTTVLHVFEKLKINSTGDEIILDQVKHLMNDNSREFNDGNSGLKSAITDIKCLHHVLSQFNSAEREFQGITKNVMDINSLISNTVRESNLVFLNTSIDNSRKEEMEDKNYETLSSELNNIVTNFDEFSEKNAQITSRANMKVKEIGLSMKNSSQSLSDCLAEMEKVNRVFEKLKSNNADMERDQNQVVQRVHEHYAEIKKLESASYTYLMQIDNALEEYDQLSANVESTILIFDKMDSGIKELKKVLDELDAFRTLFKIG